MISTSFELSCDIELLVLTILILVLFMVYISSKRVLHRKSTSEKLIHLTEVRTALLLQQDSIQKQIENIDIVIQQLSSESLPVNSTVSQTPESIPLTSENHTAVSPPRPQSQTILRRRPRHTRIGEPYPLPFNPPRTPEEERQNSVTVWINELRLKNISSNGNTG
jgi:hypothetical protein